ncbi:SRPBCC family protein [Rhodococcus sp. PAMC28707]|uniref:SRPBCC family protein n=1 Tax=unclassified Rhodococcus (in: high G+C Gram-positive bacteria) TaxID=192944 RepID=UPI00109E2291|nr:MULTISPECIES: SRPBCC family protein [unclassified Rhodococcus (in: high G+C Gram-positive bacteria)]QCB48985.1 SRPBCC family protein [Rhodococcus sp. PAMC28705]QCB59328.1 SRPBCC family protein [Rhodococcus sp. PAMC28707]
MSKTLEATIDIDANPEQVWKIISDLKRMGEWSPQCKLMKVFGGDVRRGTTTLNINRKGLLVWPTRSKVIEFEPNKKIAFRVLDNKTIWSYSLTPNGTGTSVVEKREAPSGTTAISSFLVKNVLGGSDQFDIELVDGMNKSLQRIKAETEKG